jgi:hypothetical protein
MHAESGPATAEPAMRSTAKDGLIIARAVCRRYQDQSKRTASDPARHS